MATNPSTLAENVGRITAPDANYTYGSAKDDTTGTAGDGTPIKSALMNDSYGFFQAAMVAAGIVPSGSAETVLQSQVLQALQGVVGSFSDKRHWPTVANGADADHDIVFSAGKITDSTGRVPIVLASDLTKQIDNAWAAGTNVGGLFSGSVVLHETYHLFLIVKDSDGSVDAGFDIDPDAANIPVGYAAYRRIALVVTDLFTNIRPFTQRRDEFTLLTNTASSSSTVNNGVVQTVSNNAYPSGLPNLVSHIGFVLTVTGTPNSAAYVSVTPSDKTPENDDVFDIVANNTGEFVTRGAAVVSVPMGLSGQYKYRGDFTSGTATLASSLQGWTDDRG